MQTTTNETGSSKWVRPYRMTWTWTNYPAHFCDTKSASLDRCKELYRDVFKHKTNNTLATATVEIRQDDGTWVVLEGYSYALAQEVAHG